MGTELFVPTNKLIFVLTVKFLLVIISAIRDIFSSEIEHD
jgi:hypothetical protein